jgi:hypothetical protein
MIQGCRIPAGVDQHEVIIIGVETVAFQPVLVIHQRPRPAQFLYKHIIS